MTTPQQTLPDGEIAKQGFLDKIGGKIARIWERRYCLIKGTCLIYCGKKQDSKVVGVIELMGCWVHHLPPDHPYREHCFGISHSHTKHKMMVFAASSAKEMEEWIEVCIQKGGVNVDAGASQGFKISPFSVKEGYLAKRHHNRAGTSRRYFSLAACVLQYYHAKTDRTFSGEISVRGAEIKLEPELGPNTFSVRPKTGRAYILTGDNETDVKEWVDVLQQQARDARISLAPPQPRSMTTRPSTVSSRTSPLDSPELWMLVEQTNKKIDVLATQISLISCFLAEKDPQYKDMCFPSVVAAGQSLQKLREDTMKIKKQSVMSVNIPLHSHDESDAEHSGMSDSEFSPHVGANSPTSATSSSSVARGVMPKPTDFLRAVSSPALAPITESKKQGGLESKGYSDEHHHLAVAKVQAQDRHRKGSSQMSQDSGSGEEDEEDDGQQHGGHPALLSTVSAPQSLSGTLSGAGKATKEEIAKNPTAYISKELISVSASRSPTSPSSPPPSSSSSSTATTTTTTTTHVSSLGSINASTLPKSHNPNPSSRSIQVGVGGGGGGGGVEPTSPGGMERDFNDPQQIVDNDDSWGDGGGVKSSSGEILSPTSSASAAGGSGGDPKHPSTAVRSDNDANRGSGMEGSMLGQLFQDDFQRVIGNGSVESEKFNEAEPEPEPEPEEDDDDEDVQTDEEGTGGPSTALPGVGGGGEGGGGGGGPSTLDEPKSDAGKDKRVSFPVAGRSILALRKREIIQKREETKQAKEVEKKEKKKAAKRSQVMEEVVQSEGLYVKFLDILIDQFLNPMRGAGFNIEQVNKVFANVESIVKIHHEILAELKAERNIPATFNKFAEHLRMYTVYVSNYDSAMKEVQSLMDSKTFQKFLDNKRKDLAGTGGLDIMSYLIMPIQRIPRYRMLLAEMQDATDPNHPEYEQLTEALEKIKKIAAYINEKKRAVDEIAQVMEIQNRIQNKYQLVQPTRYLIHEFVGIFKKDNTPVILFLFNDIIMWTTGTCQFKGVLPLGMCNVEFYNYKKQQGFTVSDISGSQKPLTFCYNNANEQGKWVNRLIDETNRVKLERRNARDRKHRGQRDIHTQIKNSLMAAKAGTSEGPSSPTSGGGNNSGHGNGSGNGNGNNASIVANAHANANAGNNAVGNAPPNSNNSNSTITSPTTSPPQSPTHADASHSGEFPGGRGNKFSTLNLKRAKQGNYVVAP